MQEQLLRMQAETTARMHGMMQILIPKKSPLDKYKKQKLAFTAMLAAKDISNDAHFSLVQS